jgi:hypothetical protein
MTSIKAKVTQGGLTKAKVNPQQEVVVTNYRVNVSNISLSDLVDVAAGAPLDGALLSFNGDSGTWEAKRIIENQNTEFNGGHF